MNNQLDGTNHNLNQVDGGGDNNSLPNIVGGVNKIMDGVPINHQATGFTIDINLQEDTAGVIAHITNGNLLLRTDTVSSF